MSFNGNGISITPPQHAPHSIELPTDRSTLPPRVLEALDQALDAQDKHTKAMAKISTNRPAVEKTGDALTEAWNNLVDTAFATAENNQQHHREQFTYAARKLERALEDAKAAVLVLGAHALLFDTAANSPARIGIDRKSRTKAVTMLRCLQESLDALPDVPPIDA